MLTNADVQRIKAQGDQMDQLSKQIIALHEHRPDDAKWNPTTKEWDDGGAWKDEVSALERKYNKMNVGNRSELRSHIVSDEWLTKLGKKIFIE